MIRLAPNHTSVSSLYPSDTPLTIGITGHLRTAARFLAKQKALRLLRGGSQAPAERTGDTGRRAEAADGGASVTS